MTDQKADNLLNLALDTPEEEREQTEELNVGYIKSTRSWELIVKYNGDLAAVLSGKFPGAKMTELLGGFAVLTVPEAQVEDVIALSEIEYAEKPKRLFFAVNQGRAASCISPLQAGESGLFGNGVLVAVIDSGIDYFHDDFRNPDGTSRILYLNDQRSGATYTKAQID